MFKQRPAVLDPSTFYRVLTHRISPSTSLKRPKLSLLKSKVLILLIALLPPCSILKFTISWSLQPRLHPAFTSSTSPSVCVYKVQQHTSPCWLLHYLHEKFITDALQEPPGLHGLVLRVHCGQDK